MFNVSVYNVLVVAIVNSRQNLSTSFLLWYQTKMLSTICCKFAKTVLMPSSTVTLMIFSQVLRRLSKCIKQPGFNIFLEAQPRDTISNTAWPQCIRHLLEIGIMFGPDLNDQVVSGDCVLSFSCQAIGNEWVIRAH